jgi:rare lipoprotein A
MKRIVIIPVLLISIISNSKTSIFSSEKSSENFTLNTTKDKAKSNSKKPSLNKKVKQKLPQKGNASYYSDRYSGKLTSNAERYNPNLLTAAHETLPLGKMVRVTNISNNQSVVVKINDRCDCRKHGRIIDLSKTAAEQLKMIELGISRVKLEEI